MFIALSLLVCVIGAIVYLATSGKATELGRLSFGCGLLAFLLGAAREGVRLFS